MVQVGQKFNNWKTEAVKSNLLIKAYEWVNPVYWPLTFLDFLLSLCPLYQSNGQQTCVKCKQVFPYMVEFKKKKLKLNKTSSKGWLFY